MEQRDRAKPFLEHSTVIAGFGGQGVILAGKVLARSGMESGLEVSWLPSYGPEMRGGTANCTVILSERPIGSPMAENPFALIALNGPSLDKFGPQVREGGNIVLNSSLVKKPFERPQVTVARLELSKLTGELGNQKTINTLALGGWVRLNRLLELEEVEAGMELLLKEEGKEEFIEINLKALRLGFEAAKPS